MKKLLLSLFALNMFVAFSFAANLSISPDSWSLGRDCVVGFDIVLDSEWEKLLWADLLIDSSMKFVDFVPGDLFKNALPPVVQAGNIVRLGLFSFPDNLVDNWWILGTIYFKDNSSNYDSYINFIIKWEKSTVDTSLFVEWGIDILENVSWGSYIMDGESCVHDISNEEEVIIEWWFWWVTYDEAIEELKNDIKKDERKRWFKNFISSLWFKLWFVGLILILIIIFFIVKRRWSKKEK